MTEVVLVPAAEAFTEVGVWVATLLVAVGVVQRLTGGRLLAAATRSRARAVLASAALGAVPGCGGALLVVPLYLGGSVSFGALTAALVATMGDSSFVLLATAPLLGLAVHAGLLAVGIATGLAVDALGLAPATRPGLAPAARPGLAPATRPALAPAARAPTALAPAGGGPRATLASAPTTAAFAGSTVGAAAAKRGLLGERRRAGPAPSTVAFALLVLLGLVTAVPVTLQLAEPVVVAGVELPLAVGLAGVGLSLAAALAQRRSRRRGVACERARPGALDLDAIARDTAGVVAWVAVILVAVEVLLAAGWLGLAALSGAGLLAVGVGALVGLLPGCGAHLALTGLWAQGLLPVSGLVANAVSQDGDALLPLLVADRRAAVLASAVTLVPALAVGGLVHLVVSP